MAETFSDPAKLTSTAKSVPEDGAHVSTMQSAGQKSPSSVLPSSQVSSPTISPLPQPVVRQLASQPSPLTRFASSQVSGAVVVPSPQMVQSFVQPSVGSTLPSSHSSGPSITPSPQTNSGTVVLVVVVTTVVVVVSAMVVDVVGAGQLCPAGSGRQRTFTTSLSFRAFRPSALFFLTNALSVMPASPGTGAPFFVSVGMTASTCAPQAEPDSSCSAAITILPAGPFTPFTFPFAVAFESAGGGAQPATAWLTHTPT